MFVTVWATLWILMTQVIDAYREENNEFWLRLSALRPASLRMVREDRAAA